MAFHMLEMCPLLYNIVFNFLMNWPAEPIEDAVKTETCFDQLRRAVLSAIAYHSKK